jgi:hypothetical protein
MRLFLVAATLVLGLVAVDAASSGAQPVVNRFALCLETEAKAAIDLQLKAKGRPSLIEARPIGRQILQICTRRLPAEARENSSINERYTKTLTQEYLNRMMEVELERSQRRRIEQEHEYAARTAPHLRADSDEAVRAYKSCLFESATALALNSAEPAETISRATFAACRADRSAIREVHLRYRDKDFSEEFLVSIDRVFSDAVILEIIKARIPPVRSPAPTRPMTPI